METKERQQITVRATVNAPADHVWTVWNEPGHIVQWAHASDDWHTTRAENDLRVGGSFLSRMEAKDGSFGFDFGGVYTEVTPKTRIAYTMGDGRNVTVSFTENGSNTDVEEIFDAENTHSVEMQQAGWQAILDNFKKHCEVHYA